MLSIRRNFGLLFVFIKRSIADCCFKGNKHYEFFIRHIKTDLNNHSYIIKQTTAIPKEIRNLSPISDRGKPSSIGPQNFNNPHLPFSKHSKLKVTNDTGNIFLEKNVLLQDSVNKLVTRYSTKEHNLRKYEHDIFANNDHDKEFIQSNYQENYVHPDKVNQIVTSFHDEAITNDSKRLSLINIKELLRNKIENLLTTNFNKNDILPDDNMVVILNQKKCEKGTLLFFKNKDLHVIESPHANLENEVKNYIKKLDFNGKNKSASERINTIKFSKISLPDNLFETTLCNSGSSKGHFSIEPDSHLANSCMSLNNMILKVKNSVPLEQNIEKFWIPYEENHNNVKEINRENYEHGTSQNYNGFSPQSGPPFTEKVPIKRDKLIEESVVPNTSILDIINSIDKSAVIIQKDLYITDRIITKIQKEEEEKHKEIDKNKLETSANKGYVLYLDAPSIENGMVTLSLAGLPAGIKELSLNDKQKELNISNNKQSLITTENLIKEKHKSLQQHSPTRKKNLDVRQITGNELGPPASVTLNSIDDDGKISLNMLYEPNRVVPMFSFISKKESTKGDASRTLDNRTLNVKEISHDHQAITTASLQHNYQPSTSCKNQLTENKFLPKKTITKKLEKKQSKSLKEEPRYTINDNKPQRNLLKDYIPHKKIFVYDSCEISPGEGIPVDVYVSRIPTTNSNNNETQLANMKNSLQKHTENKFPSSVKKSLETLSKDHFPNKETSDFNKNPNVYVKNTNNCIPNSQNKRYNQLRINKGQKNNIENKFSKLNKLINLYQKNKQLQMLSDVKESFETLKKDYSLKKKISVSNGLKNEPEKQYSEIPSDVSSHISQNTVLAVLKSLEMLLKNYILNKEISVSNAEQNESEKQYSKTSKEKPNNKIQNVEPETIQPLETMRKNNILNEESSVPNVLQNESIVQFSEAPQEEPRNMDQHTEANVMQLFEILPKNYISNKEMSVPNVLNNESEKQYLEAPKKNPNNTAQNALLDAIKSLETLLKNYVPNEEILDPKNLKNGSKNKYLKTPKQNSTCAAQNITPDTAKSLETSLNNCIPNQEISVSNVPKGDCKINFSGTRNKQPTHTVQNISPDNGTMQTCLKEYNAKREISFSDSLRNKSEKKSLENSKEESRAQNTVLDIITSLETLLKDKILERGRSVSNSLENETEKKYSEKPIEIANYRDQNTVPDVSQSLETLLKENNLEREISVSNSLENESENKYLDIALEETSHRAQNTVSDKIRSLEKLLKEYFSETDTSVSSANSPVERIQKGHQVNTNTYFEENTYEQSNATNIELEVMENDFLKQEKITNESEKKSPEIYEKNVELLSKKERSLSNIIYPDEDHECFSEPNNTETISKDKNIHQNKNKALCTNNKKLPEENIQEPNNISQYTLTEHIDCPKLNSLECSNEDNSKFIIKKENMDAGISTTKEDSNNDKRSLFCRINSSGRKSDVEVHLKNNTHSNLSTIHDINNESNQPLLMKSDGLHSGSSSVSGNSGKKSSNERKNVKKLNVIPDKKQFEISNTNNSSVDCVKKTTISTVEKNNFTDINVSEVETYVDSRLPIPFSTETFFQIFGSNHSLRDHSYLIDVAKYKLTSPNKITDQRPNLSIMAKLDDIQKRVRYLNVLAMNSKSLGKDKNTRLKNEALFSTKKVSESSAKNQGIAKHGIKEQTETSKNRKEETVNKENVSNLVPKLSLKIFKNNQPIKAHNLKEMNKQNIQNQKNTNEIKKEDHETSSKEDKSLLVVDPTNENIKEIKIDTKKPGIQKAALAGIRVSKGKYIDLFNFNENEKNKRHKVQGHKKGVYDHRGLSKRDKKILREITKEIPKKKSKRRSIRKVPIRSITRRKTVNENGQPILPKKDSESVKKNVLPNTHLLNKQKLLPPGKHGPEKQEVQKTFINKIENTSHKVIPSIGQKSVENKQPLKSEREKSKEIKLDQPLEKNKIPESKSTKVERYNVPKIGNLKQVTESDKISLKNSESKNSKNYGGNVEKTLCQTYVATETYINQPEKTYIIPEKIFTSKKILKTNPTQQKITILENNKTNKEDNTVKIHEGFKEDLIRKSQNKIEQRTNIDFRVRTPKLKNPKSKVITLKNNQKGKLGPATVLEKTPMLKKYEKKSDIKNQQLLPKKQVKNRIDPASSKEIRPAKKTSTTKKIASVQTVKNEELHKINQVEPHNKETFTQPRSKTIEIVNTKPIDRMAKGTEKQDNEQLKIVTPDQLKHPMELTIGKKASKTGPSENFPILLIDVDKMSKEIKPELDQKNCQKCQVAHDKISDFPLHNQKKKLLFKPPFKILNLGPSNDPMLRNELKLFPSVTKVMNSTIPETSREILREWRKSMIDQLGENGFKAFYRGELINGSKFNWQLHNFLLIGDKNKHDPNNLSLKSIENVLGRTSDLSAINSHVIHRKLAYRGVIDCVAKYQNKPVLIEWKRLENPQVKISNSSIDVAATQLSAYVGALNYDDAYKFQISGGLIVLAYSDGSEAEVIEINNEQCYKHWKMWLKRLQTYHELSRKRTK